MNKTVNNIFQTSETLYLRIQTIKQRIQRLEKIKSENTLSVSEEKELLELLKKAEPLNRRLAEIHQLILEYSVRIKSDNERFIVIEYFVNHASRSDIVNVNFYDRSGVYKIIKKYKGL